MLVAQINSMMTLMWMRGLAHIYALCRELSRKSGMRMRSTWEMHCKFKLLRMKRLKFWGLPLMMKIANWLKELLIMRYLLIRFIMMLSSIRQLRWEMNLVTLRVLIWWIKFYIWVHFIIMIRILVIHIPQIIKICCLN